MTLAEGRRRALCLLVGAVADGADDDLVAELASAFGLRGASDGNLAAVVRGLFNVTCREGAGEALTSAGVDRMVSQIDSEAVPLLRCIVTLGGMLKEVQRALRSEWHHDVPLELATLWQPFAIEGSTM